jgi:hypothetical protein
LNKTIAPEIGAEVALSVTCPVTKTGSGGNGFGEGDVAVLFPELHADANITSRPTQPRLNIGVRASFLGSSNRESRWSSNYSQYCESYQDPQSSQRATYARFSKPCGVTQE